MRKSILIYCTQLMPAGGIESHIVEFCKNMSAYFDIDMIVGNFRMPRHETVIKKYCRKVFLVKGNTFLKRYAGLFTALSGIRKASYDVLYTNGIGASIWVIGKMVNYKKWILHHHMAADENFFTTLNRQYKSAMASADHVIACSGSDAINLRRLLKRHVDVVYCFSRDLSNNTKHKEWRSRFNFGYYGRLIQAKGIELICMLSADADCRHITFHIWGSGNEYPPSYFKQYPNVFYHGSFNTEEELVEVIASIDAFLLLTTHAEGLPISLLEVMSAGIPWISANKGGIHDIACNNTATKLVHVEDFNMVKQAVLAMANDISLGTVSRDTQMALYKKKFSPGVLVAEWKALYESQPYTSK